MSLSKTPYPLLSTDSTQENPSRHDWKIVDWDNKNQNKQITAIQLQEHLKVKQQGPKVIKLFSNSTQLSKKFILLINDKILTIVGFLTCISMMNTTSERLKARNFFICRYFSFYEQLKFQAQLSWAWKKLHNLRGQVLLSRQGPITTPNFAYGFHYKSPSWVWGWDRKIRPKDHRLASRGLPNDDNRWSRGTDFSIPSSHELWILFLAHHLIPQSYFKTSRKPWIRWDAAWWRHCNITPILGPNSLQQFYWGQRTIPVAK